MQHLSIKEIGGDLSIRQEKAALEEKAENFQDRRKMV